MSVTSPISNRWLFNPGTDLLLGCGLGYGLMFILLFFAGDQITHAFPFHLTPLIALFLSVPHYGATLLRVYEKKEDRTKYSIFSIHLTAAIWLWFIGGVYNDLAGSLLVTLYLSWSPWHYMAQNYGIASMFLGRRGVRVKQNIKRLLHLSFIISFVLAITEIHSFIAELPEGDSNYQMLTLDLPPWLRDAIYVLAGSAYIVVNSALIYALLKIASLRDIYPTLLIILTQALWFIVPLAAMRLEIGQGTVALSREDGQYAFFWIAMGHAIQYLWITTYFAKKSGEKAGSAFLGKSLFAGALIWVIPGLLFAPNLLGRVSYESGLAILVAAAVNVHHFMLDGVIWKLRDGPIARILLTPAEPQLKQQNALSKSFYRYSFYILGIACVGIHHLSTTSQIAFYQAWVFSDIEDMKKNANRLEILGREEIHHQEAITRVKNIIDKIEQKEID